MPAKHQKITIEIDPDFGADERERIADDVIEFMKRRSERGKDVDGERFVPYSETYINSLDFKIAGKSRRNVNLHLSGDMLEAITLLSHKKGKLVIGFENGSEENARADGNIRGSYGRSPDPSKARDFLGIADKDLEKILSLYR